VGVVHDLLAHVDRSTVLLQGLFDRDDSAVHPGAVTPGLGEQDTAAIRRSHAPHPMGGERRPRPGVAHPTTPAARGPHGGPPITVSDRFRPEMANSPPFFPVRGHPGGPILVDLRPRYRL